MSGKNIYIVKYYKLFFSSSPNDRGRVVYESEKSMSLIANNVSQARAEAVARINGKYYGKGKFRIGDIVLDKVAMKGK